MNKYRRRQRPNLRHTVEFWIPTSVPDASGELKQEFVMHYRGPFAMELPLAPTFLLLGQWCKPASTVTAGMFAVIPSLQKVYAVQGNATDQWGSRQKIQIRIVDNVTQTITTQVLSTIY
jgi:hypothetical protein